MLSRFNRVWCRHSTMGTRRRVDQAGSANRKRWRRGKQRISLSPSHSVKAASLSQTFNPTKTGIITLGLLTRTRVHRGIKPASQSYKTRACLARTSVNRKTPFRTLDPRSPRQVMNLLDAMQPIAKLGPKKETKDPGGLLTWPGLPGPRMPLSSSP